MIFFLVIGNLSLFARKNVATYLSKRQVEVLIDT